MLTVALCDDEAYYLEQLQHLVGNYLTERAILAHIIAFSTGAALLEANCDFDLILMDVQLPEKTGIDVVSHFREQGKLGQVIFVTAYQEYALPAFDLDAVHYILKPISKEKLEHALDKAIKIVLDGDGEKLSVSKGSKVYYIYVREILYCEAIDHKVYIYTPEASYDYFGTIEALEKELDRRFFRCHRSFIVNMDYVIGKDQETATVLGGKQILVSRRKRQAFTQHLLQYFRKEIL